MLANIFYKPGGTMGDLYVTNRLKRDQEGNVWIDRIQKMYLVKH